MLNRLYRFISLLIVVSFSLSLLALNVFANDDINNSIISFTTEYFEDGSRNVLIVISCDENRSTKTVSNIMEHYSSENELIWRVKLTGSFTYNGITSSCTDAYTTITLYKSGWSVISENTNHSGNTAATAVVLGKNVLGIVLPAATINLSLTCDKDGNIS